jgi:hypothetical protein
VGWGGQARISRDTRANFLGKSGCACGAHAVRKRPGFSGVCLGGRGLYDGAGTFISLPGSGATSRLGIIEINFVGSCGAY